MMSYIFTSCHLMMAISMSCTVDQKKALNELGNDVLKAQSIKKDCQRNT